MKEMRRNLLVGLFVLFGLTALGILIVLFGQGPGWMTGTRNYPLVILFNNASGIKPGTLVTVFGKEIGRVQDVEFRDLQRLASGVKVVVSVESRYRLRKGTSAATMEAGLLAGSRPPIEITPGPPEALPLPDGAEISGRTVAATESIFPPTIIATFDKTATQVGEAAGALTPVLNDFHQLMQPRTPAEVDRPGGPTGNLSSIVSRVDTGVKNFNAIIGDPQVQSQVKDSIANIHAMSEDGKAAIADFRVAASDSREITTEGKRLVAQAQRLVADTDDQIGHVGRAATTALEGADGLFGSLRGIADSIKNGDGTLGKLVKDDRLYEALLVSVRKLSETLDKFRAVADEWIKGKVRVSF